jgi:hypothetical protein
MSATGDDPASRSFPELVRAFGLAEALPAMQAKVWPSVRLWFDRDAARWLDSPWRLAQHRRVVRARPAAKGARDG